MRTLLLAPVVLFALFYLAGVIVVATADHAVEPFASPDTHPRDIAIFGASGPVGAAVRATEIGKAMLELTARGSTLENGTKISTAGIVSYSEAYDRRQGR